MDIRFGWINDVHMAIQKGANDLMKDTPMRRFLKHYYFEVDYFSQKQDMELPGPGHFFDFEAIGAGKEVPKQQNCSFREIKRIFSPAHQFIKTDELKRDPLTEMEVAYAHQPNVMTFIVENYHLLVKQLKAFGDRLASLGPGESLDPGEKRATHMQLAETAGKLSHFIGDLFNPMHATLFDWTLPTHYKKAHLTMDGLMMTRQDYDRWERELHKRAIATGFTAGHFDFGKIKDRLIRGIEEGYLLVFEMVAKDAEARKAARTDRKSLSKKEYRKHLEAAWKPLALERMSQAAEMTAAAFKSAFVEAGRPDLDVLVK